MRLLQEVAGFLTLAPVIHQTGSGVSYGIIEAVQSAFLSIDLTDLMSLLYGLHFSARNRLRNLALVLKQDPVHAVRLLSSGLLLRLISLLHFGSLSPTMVQPCRIQPVGYTSAHIGSSGLFSELARNGSLIESNKLAAFPSLHAAYVVLFSYFTMKLKRTYGLVSLPITVGVLFSTIYLGQHYITDLAAGVTVAAACELIVTRLDKKRKISSFDPADWKALKPTEPESAT